MKEKPILMSAAMVQAILRGHKTQTRRMVKPQPVTTSAMPRIQFESLFGAWFVGNEKIYDGSIAWKSPYGLAGDKAWVKETWRTARSLDDCKPGRLQAGAPVEYAAGGFNFNASVLHDAGRWRPSIFMVRWMSRITLEIKSVRVERLQDISRGDCMAEGCPFPNTQANDPKRWYADLWDSINGAGEWDKNPWVWVVEFSPRIVPSTISRNF